MHDSRYPRQSLLPTPATTTHPLFSTLFFPSAKRLTRLQGDDSLASIAMAVDGLDPNLLRKLPVSSQWLCKLQDLGAESCFSSAGKMRQHSEQIACPLWRLQLKDFCPTGIFRDLIKVLPIVRRQKLGVKNSPKVTPFNYYTKAWSYFPCSRQYRYENHKDHVIGVIGSNFPPLHATPEEA